MRPSPRIFYSKVNTPLTQPIEPLDKSDHIDNEKMFTLVAISE